MIGYLQGNIISVYDKHLLLNVSGVGYKVFCNPGELGAVPSKDIALFIHTVVREDALELFGFLDETSLNFFEKLISISGIGPRSALGILAAGSAEDLMEAIQKGNLAYLTAVSGIGKKTAEKIILELKGALGNISSGGNGSTEEVVMALKSLGYQERDIQKVMRDLKSVSVEDKIREALKFLGK